MKSPQTLAGSIAVLLFALVVLGIGIGPVSASPGSWASGNMTALHSHGTGQPHFARNGTAPQNGHAFATNATLQQERLQAMVTKLQGQGVDTSQLQAAIQNKDTAGIKSWMQSYAASHKGSFTPRAGQKTGHAVTANATTRQAHLQAFITKLQGQGVDVSTIQTALQNNDTATVMSWLKSYAEAHPGIMGTTTHPQWHHPVPAATQSSG
ncbi:hypothetical protein [Methanoregula sp.]|uniref:hypothetical protein n=1 Tax=Methanoregula sp. TaxID=2052170 RepID=UPI002C39189F|nr:hypothetical protein [Methanoregula sp.]HVP97057.1 hypothetical protein [Methanoregula sp.]